MADLESVKVSDTLLIPVKVIHVDNAYGAPVKVVFETVEFWIDRDTAQAAEHIPAPRVFKRGDWVKVHATRPPPQRRQGIVLRLEQRTIASLRLEAEVSWPDGTTYWYVPNDLEPDEAPE